MRICGRLLRPSTLAERRLFLGHFGTPCIRIPRSLNPYAVARKVRRLVMNEELAFLYGLARRTRKHLPSPDVDHSAPTEGHEGEVIDV